METIIWSDLVPESWKNAGSIFKSWVTVDTIKASVKKTDKILTIYEKYGIDNRLIPIISGLCEVSKWCEEMLENNPDVVAVIKATSIEKIDFIMLYCVTVEDFIVVCKSGILTYALNYLQSFLDNIVYKGWWRWILIKKLKQMWSNVTEIEVEVEAISRFVWSPGEIDRWKREWVNI